MRTTVDIPDDLLNKVMYWSKAKTKKEALAIALKEYVRREAVEALLASAGTMPDFPDIIAMREEMLQLELETGETLDNRGAVALARLEEAEKAEQTLKQSA